MTAPILALAIFCFTAAAVHIASLVIAMFRLRRNPEHAASSRQFPPVSLVRPLCGIDNYATETLRSTFELDYPRFEILFCVASATDPIVPLVEALIATHAAVDARLLVGDEPVSANPKLNNLLKGWRAAACPWIIIADSNVLMPRDYVQQLFANWRADTGLVASPPIGCRPQGIWAEIECAFLNAYQARWQYSADAFGFGFAQGKTMLWRRTDLESAGGIAMLAKEVAEDAAATKIVRDAGLKVRLVDRPLAQPLGRRSAAEVWNRQLRWARLRRASFFGYFLLEIISGGVLPLIAAGIVAAALHAPVALSVGALGALWYGGEMILAAAAGWHLSALYPVYGLMRDMLLPALFVSALHGNGFVWRGNAMQVERLRPRGIITIMRSRMQDLAQGNRRRLRALRARAS
jgi:ceramide glucosyltransferase